MLELYHDKTKSHNKPPSWGQKGGGVNNVDVRRAIFESGFMKYQIAEKVGVNCYTFSKWLQTEMNDERKQRTLKAIRELKGGAE